MTIRHNLHPLLAALMVAAICMASVPASAATFTLNGSYTFTNFLESAGWETEFGYYEVEAGNAAGNYNFQTIFSSSAEPVTTSSPVNFGGEYGFYFRTSGHPSNVGGQSTDYFTTSGLFDVVRNSPVQGPGGVYTGIMISGSFDDPGGIQFLYNDAYSDLDYNDMGVSSTAAAVPLPAAVWLLGSGLVGLLGLRNRFSA